MDAQFTAIIQKIIAERGKEALFDAAKCKAFLADYTKGDFKKESRLLLLAVEAEAAKTIAETTEPETCKTQMIKKLQDDHFLSEEAAADAVDMLALVLRENTAEAETADDDEWEPATVGTASGGGSPEPAMQTSAVEANRYAQEISDLNKTIAEKNESLIKTVQEIERLNAEIQRHTKENSDLQKSIAGKNEEAERLTGQKSNEIFRLTGELAKAKKGRVVIIVAGVIALAVSIGVGLSRYSEMESRYYGQLNSYNSVKTNYDTLSANYEQKKAIWAINVTALKVGNAANGGKWLTQPGEPLKAEDMRWLNPVITYNSPINGEVTLYVKIIKPDRTIFRNESASPDGYTYQTTARLSRGKDLSLAVSSWGNGETSLYTAGEWTVEVWYEGVCLRSEKVKLN